VQKDERGRPIATLETNNDITAAKRAEEALHEARAELAHVTRMTTLGELTASIAHEVNQPLTGVVTNGAASLRWLNREVPPLDEVRGSVESMISDAKRASDVIQRVRALSKKADPEKAELHINDVIHDVVRLVQHEVLGHGASLRLELVPALPSVLGDRIQLQQVIINLVINGIQAMDSIAEHPRELLIRSQQNEEGQVLVAVKDSGIGINPEHAIRLFNAFFTTKPSGMGMGLSICRSIIEVHGGRVWASDNQGSGATFQFTLPPHRETVL
jgi:C4-dicarboxylate-specific signal transduction histidine kinase